MSQVMALSSASASSGNDGSFLQISLCCTCFRQAIACWYMCSDSGGQITFPFWIVCLGRHHACIVTAPEKLFWCVIVQRHRCLCELRVWGAKDTCMYMWPARFLYSLSCFFRICTTHRPAHQDLAMPFAHREGLQTAEPFIEVKLMSHLHAKTMRSRMPSESAW